MTILRKRTIATLSAMAVLLMSNPVANPHHPAMSPSVDTQSPTETYFTDVELVDHNGKKMRLFSDLMKDKVVIINSFISTCDRACPAVNQRMQAVQKAVGDKLGESVHLLSITVAPEADTPARLHQYAEKSQAKAGWFFLTGDKANVEFALKKFGLYVENLGDHKTTLVAGNIRTGLWKKIQGLAESAEVVKAVESVINDPGHSLKPSAGMGMGTGRMEPGNPVSPNPTPDENNERVFSGNEVDKKPLILSKPKASYTEEARKNQIQGVVILRLVFTAKGTVEQIRVVRGLPFGLSERAIEAARQIRFQPGMKNGQPVSVSSALEYSFNVY